MMQQYRDLKARDPGALLLFRMGDFYEMFDEDAERAEGLLGLAVATRDKDKGPNSTKMAGFPHQALDSYLAKLVKLGIRAAVCEQVEDPKLAKGLVKRDIVRVITPGTLTDDAFLDAKTSNYLAAIVEVKNKLGLAWVELSTGKFSLTAVSRTELADELARLNPAEVLVSEICLETPWAKALRDISKLTVTPRPSWDFVLEQARKVLFEQFHTTTLGGFGIDDEASEVQAAGALVAYLRDTQKTSLGHITRLTPYHRKDTLALDEMTRRSLELTRTLRDARREGSLLQVIDRTCTSMGARLLAEWLTTPLTSLPRIVDRHEAVAELVRDAPLRADLRSALDGATDLERLAARVGTGRANPRDLVSLARTLALLPRIKARLTARPSKRLSELEAGIELCAEVRSTIDAALVDDPPLALKEGGLIRSGYHADLDAQRDLARGGKSWITRYQAEQVRRTGISGLKIDCNKVFGYYIEVTHGPERPGGQDPRRLPPQADRQERRALHHARVEGVRGQGPQRRGSSERPRIRALRHPPRPGGRRGPPPDPGGGRARPDRRPLRPGRACRQTRLLPARDGRGTRDGDRRRPPPPARLPDALRSLRPQRPEPGSRRRTDPLDHRPQHGGQKHVHSPGGLDRDPGADGRIRARQTSPDRHRRPPLRACRGNR